MPLGLCYFMESHDTLWALMGFRELSWASVAVQRIFVALPWVFMAHVAMAMNFFFA